MTHPLIPELRRARVVPVVRTSTAARAATACEWLREAGMTILEITLTIPDARRRLVLQQECAYTGTHACPKGTTGQEQIQIAWLKLDHLVSF